ncbi:plasmid fertility inhibition factor family protein [Burkholderia cepacia]|uniref:plasmid fertility inhibition factor family protein n=1 Tax=Burkholderia cepacia TaxID=292 RepID=UPI0038B76A83
MDSLDTVWRDAPEYVGREGRGSVQDGKYEAVGAFLRCTIGPRAIIIPTISIADGTVSFTDGRHRFAWLRDHGLRALPVEVDQDSAETCRTCFGTTERVGQLDPVAH